MPPKTVIDLEAAGWTRLDLNPGETVHVPYDSAALDLVLKGQVFGSDGQMLKGKARPKISATEDDDGCRIMSSAQATVLYKLVTQDDDEDEPDAAP